MKVLTVAATRSLSEEPPRSTAYYYADLERLKRKNEPVQQNEELSEYLESNEVINDGAVREVPPLRDRLWSLQEFTPPGNGVGKVETYSTAGTFPMPEPKEKEPLLAELQVVGRLPLSQLDSASGVRRSRSWYLCCPNVAEEEISRESSWRYSSLRPVTAPPLPGQNGINMMAATQSSGQEDVATLRAERDALARALSAERQRAAAAGRAHDARLAELHGVIAELVRRRRDDQAAAIPEEDGSDECESTTQPAGELENDGDQSRTEQNDTSSALSPSDLPTPQESKVEPPDLPDNTTDTSTQDLPLTTDHPRVELTAAPSRESCSPRLSEGDSERCLTTARCGASPRGGSGGGSCRRQRGSPDPPHEAPLYSQPVGRCESRQAKVASRVRLKKTLDSESNPQEEEGEGSWCAAAERLALGVCAHADLREALVAGPHDGSLSEHVSAWRRRCTRLEAELRLVQCALERATDTAHRLYCACAVQESTSVSLCVALRAADRALETYDVLLALAETQQKDTAERAAAEQVAQQLLSRLEGEPCSAIGEPLLSPGPWLQHQHLACGEGWSLEQEARLRGHAARLKADTVSLRDTQPPPRLFSYHDISSEELAVLQQRACEMEDAVAVHEALATAERKASRRHWLDAPGAETPL